jgi:segregation and condensation protein B
MSLKAKLEAVIYAAEEPVTLAQLALLFAEDAFAWKAERQAALNAPAHDDHAELDPSETADSSLELSDLIEVALSDETAAVDTVEIPAPALAISETVPEPSADLEAKRLPVTDQELEARREERRLDREVREILRGILDELIGEYASDTRGIEIREIAGGFRMGTKPEIHDAVRSFIKSLKPPMKLSMPALETLAVIAYKQPVTAPEVGEVRGVDSAGVLGSLMSRKLITTAGRKQVVGRPIMYKTTKEFLLRFGLKDVNELPSMEEFEKMAALELSTDEEEAIEGQVTSVAESGNLFAEPEDLPDQRLLEPSAEAATATSTPTAEPSEEAAEAQALVERQNAEEIEAEP